MSYKTREIIAGRVGAAIFGASFFDSIGFLVGLGYGAPVVGALVGLVIGAAIGLALELKLERILYDKS